MPYLGQAPSFYNPNGAVNVVGAPINLNGAINANGVVNMSDNILKRPALQDVAHVRVNKGTVGTGTVTFDLTEGNVQEVTVSGPITIDITNWPSTGVWGELLAKIKNGGTATVTLPSINWVKPDGTTTTSFSTYLTSIGHSGLQSTGVDFVLVWSDDAGLTKYGKVM